MNAKTKHTHGMYNGHKNRAYWNVALWINNDQHLYSMARDYCNRFHRDMAANMMLDALLRQGTPLTPDGYAYTKTNVRAALVGIT